MNESPPALPASPPRKRRISALAKCLIVVGAILLILGSLWWWLNRPILPVVLNPAEKTIVESKVEAMQKPTYQKGVREIVLSERELNGLLNQNTPFGRSLKFELADGAIHARVETDLDPDLPVVGGRRFKARARILVGTDPGHPSLILDDLTVWGISLPNEWLAHLKGRNLLGDLVGNGGTAPLPGVEEIRIQPGQLRIRLAE